MEILFFIVVSILLGAIIYLANELRKTKIQGKLIEKELSETKEVFKKLEQSNKVSLKPGEMIIHKDTLDELRKLKFVEARREDIEKRSLENERNRILGEKWVNKGSGNNYERWYSSESQCPPKSGSCPLSYCVIPGGTSMYCSGCGRNIQSSAPMYSVTDNSGFLSTQTTTDTVIDNSNLTYNGIDYLNSVIGNLDYESNNNVSFGGSGAGSSYDDNSSSSDYSSDSGSSYSDTSSND